MVPTYYDKAKEVVKDQAVTGSWADLGDPIDMRAHTHAGLYLTWTANDSENVEIQVLAMTEGKDETPIPMNGASAVTLWTTDGSAAGLFAYYYVGPAMFIQVQVKAGTAGASAATVSMSVSKKFVGAE